VVLSSSWFTLFLGGVYLKSFPTPPNQEKFSFMCILQLLVSPLLEVKLVAKFLPRPSIPDDRQVIDGDLP
jgi:hypothetical protein